MRDPLQEIRVLAADLIRLKLDLAAVFAEEELEPDAAAEEFACDVRMMAVEAQHLHTVLIAPMISGMQ